MNKKNKVRAMSPAINIVFICLFFLSANLFGQTIEEFTLRHNEEGGLTLFDYIGDTDNVVIPEGMGDIFITEIFGGITSGAFEGKQLTSIVIPNGVKKIGWNAFVNNRLTSITIPAGLDLRGSFENNFEDAYNKEGKKGGTYQYRNNKWILTSVNSAPYQTTEFLPPPPTTDEQPRTQTEQPESPSNLWQGRQLGQTEQAFQPEQSERTQQMQLTQPQQASEQMQTGRTTRADLSPFAQEMAINIPIFIDPDNMRIHRAKPKESLSSIARQYYGAKNARFFPILMLATGAIDDPDKIEIGQLIAVPDLMINRLHNSTSLTIRQYFYHVAALYAQKGDIAMTALLIQAAKDW